MNRPDPLLGRTIGEKYRVLECIGGGGFGRVYKAEHQPVGRIVALKVINETVQNEPELRQRFLREARSVALLKSTHVVPLFDFGEEPDGLLYMVFEFIEGRTLKDILIAQGALSLGDAVRYSIEILEGLSEAHEHGIIHRDLKPANIMITAGAWGQNQARVLDFGVAKMLDTEHIDALELTTQQGIVLGTPHYMSPEQARNRGVDRRADIYALGTLLYTMVAGRPPYLAESTFEILQKQIDEPVSVPLNRLNLPTEFVKILANAMAKDPTDRYQNARDMAEALAPFSQHVDREGTTTDTAPEIDPLAIQSRPSLVARHGMDPSQRTMVPTPRSRFVWLLGGVLVLGSLVWFIQSQDEVNQESNQSRSTPQKEAVGGKTSSDERPSDTRDSPSAVPHDQGTNASESANALSSDSTAPQDLQNTTAGPADAPKRQGQKATHSETETNSTSSEPDRIQTSRTRSSKTTAITKTRHYRNRERHRNHQKKSSKETLTVPEF